MALPVSGLMESCGFLSDIEILQGYDVGIFMMQVEETYIVTQQMAIEDAVLHHHNMKSIGESVNSRRSDTTARTLAADDERLYPVRVEMISEIGAEKGARPSAGCTSKYSSMAKSLLI